MSRKGQDALIDGNLEEAKIRFTKVLDACPYDSDARRHYARTLWRQGDHELAIEEMKAATMHSGDNPDWTVELGRMLFDHGQFGDAMNCASRALSRDAGSIAGWKLRGDVYQQQGQIQDALDAYYKSLSCGSDDADLRFAIARVHLTRGRPDRALSAMQRIMDAYPRGEEPPEVALEYGLALAALDRHEEAVESLASARSDLANDPRLANQLARSYMSLSKSAEAHTTVVEALEIHPGQPELLATLQQVRLANARFAEPPVRSKHR